MSTETRRSPDEFLDDARAIIARRDQPQDPPIDPAAVDQVRAASRDARKFMGDALEDVVDVDLRERDMALVLAMTAAAERRGLRSPHGLARPRPEFVDLQNPRDGHCDVCDTRAHRLAEMLAQAGPYIFRARVCVRCRLFAPEPPLDETA